MSDSNFTRPLSSSWGRAWWVALASGVVLIGLAVLFFVQPFEVTITLVWLIGFSWFISGVAKLIGLFFDGAHWGFRLPSALLSLLVGAWIVFPESGERLITNTTTVLDVIVLIWGTAAMLAGALSLAAVIRSHNYVELFFPLAELLLAAYLLANLFIAALTLPYLCALLVLVAGIAQVATALMGRSAIRTNYLQ